MLTLDGWGPLRALRSGDNDREEFGLIEDDHKTDIVFGHLKFFGEISTGRLTYAVSGVNRPLAADELTTLANLLLEFGAVDAMNLDGGGSTTMVIHNKIVNRPSDQTGERPVSDAILVFPRPH